MSSIDLTHGDFVLDFSSLCNICHWVIVPPVKLKHIAPEKEMSLIFGILAENWELYLFVRWSIYSRFWWISHWRSNSAGWIWMRLKGWNNRFEQLFLNNVLAVSEPVESPCSNLDDSILSQRFHFCHIFWPRAFFFLKDCSHLQYIGWYGECHILAFSWNLFVICTLLIPCSLSRWHAKVGKILLSWFHHFTFVLVAWFTPVRWPLMRSIARSLCFCSRVFSANPNGTEKTNPSSSYWY